MTPLEVSLLAYSLALTVACGIMAHLWRQSDRAARWWQQRCEGQETAVNALQVALKLSQRNDTPQDPETGRFTSPKEMN